MTPELGDLSLGLRNCGPSLLQLMLKIAVHRSDDDSSLIRKFEKNLSEKQLIYEFVDAFPLNLISMPVSYAQSEVLKLSVSFSYTRYVRYRSSGNLLKNYGLHFDPKGPDAS